MCFKNFFYGFIKMSFASFILTIGLDAKNLPDGDYSCIIVSIADKNWNSTKKFSTSQIEKQGVIHLNVNGKHIVSGHEKYNLIVKNKKKDAEIYMDIQDDAAIVSPYYEKAPKDELYGLGFVLKVSADNPKRFIMACKIDK